MRKGVSLSPRGASQKIHSIILAGTGIVQRYTSLQTLQAWQYMNKNISKVSILTLLVYVRTIR